MSSTIQKKAGECEVTYAEMYGSDGMEGFDWAALLKQLLSMLTGCFLSPKQREQALAHPSPLQERRMERVIGRFPGTAGREDAIKQTLLDTGFHTATDEGRKLLAEAR